MLAIAGQTAESNLLVVTPWVPWGNKGLSLKFDFFKCFLKFHGQRRTLHLVIFIS